MTTPTTVELPITQSISNPLTQLFPLAVDIADFDAGRFLGADTVAYQLGDANADADQSRALALPEIADDALADIQPGAVPTSTPAPSDRPYSLTHSTVYPAGIAAGDLIEIVTCYWSNRNSNAPTATGYTLRWSHAGAATYDIKIAKLYKIADGTESGSVTVTLAGGASNTVPMSLAVIVTRGVDQANPYDTTEEVNDGNSNVDPDAITTVTDGAVVQVIAGGRKWGGVSSADIPGYNVTVDQTANNWAGLLIGYKKIGTAGTEDPAALDYPADETTVVTDALRPASGFTGYTLVVVATSADETATAALAASDCTLVGRSEVQTISSVLGSGTFTLSYDGDTTAAIDFDATATEIATALDGLTTLDALDIIVSGGPLNTGEVYVEFTNALAEQDVPTITSSTGSVTIATTIPGYIPRNFGEVTDINIPRDGGTMEPQTVLWALSPSGSYEAGREIDFSVADHDGLKSWAAAVIVFGGLDTSTTFGSVGTEVTGEDASVDLGSMIPGDRGSRGLVVISKAQVSGSYGIKKNAGTPARTSPIASAVADGMSLDLFLTPHLTTSPLDLGPSVWTGNEKYAAAVVELIPADPIDGSSSLADVLVDGQTSTWAELAALAGDLSHIFEVDIAGIPGDAWIVGAYVEFEHSSDAAHKIDLVPCGMATDLSSIVFAEDSAGYCPEPLGTIVSQTTPRVDDLSDSSTLNDYPRLGFAVLSKASAVNLKTHRLYHAKLVLEVLVGGPVVSNVTGPTVAGDPVGWSYSSAGGHPQTHYQVMVIAGASQDPDTAVVGNPWSATAGTIVYDSGMIADSGARSLEINDPLARGDCTYAVRAWARLAGRLVFSDWSTANINITGSPPTAPTVDSNAEYDEDLGVVRVGVELPADATRGFLHRSIDGGSTFVLAGDPVEIGASTIGDLVDPTPPLGINVLYRIGADNGPMTESVWAPENGAEVERFYQPTKWYLQVVAEWQLNTSIDVVAGSFRRVRPKVTQRVQGPDSSASISTVELASDFAMTIRVRGKAARDALDTVLARTDALRLVNILGQTWIVQPFGDIEERLQRWQPAAGETTALSDSHLIPLELVEISHAGIDTSATGIAYPSDTLFPS